jgi:nicotinamidase-related amidase
VSAAFGGRAGAGRAPALVVVDVTLGFTDPASPLACDLDGPVGAIGELLAAARAAATTVVFTTVAYGPGDHAAAATFLAKVPALGVLEAGSRWAQVDPRIAPRPTEPVLVKLFASAFFATPLASLLTARGHDGLVVCGASTSGCVRATVVDALQHGFRPVVAREAVGDRDPAAHEQALRDVDGRYGDVVELGEAAALLARS